ncbi:MAG TPA: sulfotransferase [Candidatus Saccharimonadales bacterium]|nr:sulfotransferase [Candidatus Saccharimonadales bacterium]
MQKVFIIGNPRSGTSLFRLMLNSHSEVIAPPESGFLHWWSNKYNNWNKLSNTKFRVEEFLSDLKTSKKIENWKLDFEELKKIILKEKPKDYSHLTELVYSTYAMRRGKNSKIIADKNNYFIYHLDDLVKIWPNAKIIFMVRDGRDVACSYITLNKISTDSPYKPKLPTKINNIAKEWTTNNQRVQDFIQKLSRDRSLLIKYEDLILHPEQTLKNVCSFLKIEFEKGMFEYYIHNARYEDEPISTIDWKRKTLEKPDKTNIGKYKKELNKQQIQEFNNIAGKMLETFGYRI